MLSDLLDFGQAGADEHHPGVRPLLLLNQPPMGQGRRDHRGHEGGERGIIFDNQVVDGGAAGAQDGGHLPRVEQLLIPQADLVGPQGRFLHLVEPQGFQRGDKAAPVFPAVDAYVGRGQAGHGAYAGVGQHAEHGGGVVDHGFGLLRADVDAPAAEDAAVLDDLHPVVYVADGLHGAVLEALIAVFTIGFLDADIPHEHNPSFRSNC